MPLSKEGKTNFKYILIVVILGFIVSVGILRWIVKQEIPLAELPEMKRPEKEPTVLEGKITKEDYVSAVVWAIETKDKERYVLIGEKSNELIDIGEGTEVKLEGYKTETTVTIPEAGEFHEYTREAIEVINYEKISKIETANWKTYRNEKYGFEFQYPKVFSENEQCAAREIDDAIVVGSRVWIYVEDSKGLNLVEYVDQDLKSDENILIESEENMEVGNREALIIKYRIKGTMRYGEVIYVLKDGKIYILSFVAGGECSVVYKMDYSELNLLHDIISTFKFLE